MREDNSDRRLRTVSTDRQPALHGPGRTAAIEVDGPRESLLLRVLLQIRRVGPRLSRLTILSWSYGVLLWELFSLGEVPYGGIQTTELLEYLERDHRLEQPALCPDEMSLSSKISQ